MKNTIHHPNPYDHHRWIEQLSQFSRQMLLFFDEVKLAALALGKKGLSGLMKETRFFFSKATALDYIGGGLSAAFGFFSTLVVLGGFGLLAYQVLLWLMDGVWTEYPVILVFNALFENTALHQWMNAPESWLGLQKLVHWLLENTPLSLALIVPGLLAAFATAGLMLTATGIRYYQFKNQQHG
ncbi:MAG: hypothetical protein JSU88_12755 [Nitrospinaceae bacterium]|nr:MAG: hypothetical protein JSU88_12755 [Nitrospinaceae bacterium]